MQNDCVGKPTVLNSFSAGKYLHFALCVLHSVFKRQRFKSEFGGGVGFVRYALCPVFVKKYLLFQSFRV